LYARCDEPVLAITWRMVEDASTDRVVVTACGPERAADVHRLTQLAFGRHSALDPPSSAGRESLDHVRDDLAAGGGAIAEIEGRAVGCLRWEPPRNGDLYVKRVAVEPGLMRRGVGRALVAWVEQEALRRGCETVSVGVRVALPDNIAFFTKLDYVVEEEHRHDGYDHTTYCTMRKRL